MFVCVSIAEADATKTSVSETIGKPPLAKAQTTLRIQK